MTAPDFLQSWTSTMLRACFPDVSYFHSFERYFDFDLRHYTFQALPVMQNLLTTYVAQKDLCARNCLDKHLVSVVIDLILTYL